MKVKRFSASNNQEALNLVRNELGSDAVILYQRKVKQRGLFGFFKKPMIEIVAATEDKSNHRSKETEKNYQSPADILKSKVNNIKQQMPSQEINRDVNEIKDMLNVVITKMSRQQLPDLLKSIDDEEMLKLFNLFKEQELDEGIIEEIINEYIVLKNSNPSIIKEKESLRNHIIKIISKYMIYQKKSSNSKIMFFIGPTGVGKTTTIAKLAARYSLNEGKTVGLISADTYRIAAVEQLKTYSDILNMPLEVIYSPSEIFHAINKLKEQDIIMVDTAGRNHKNTEQVLELRKLLDEIDEKEVYLVISSASKESVIKEIIRTYSFIDDYNIIFTKIDEAESFGTIINTIKETKRPLSYITTGQSVPDDIEAMDVEKIVSLLLKECI